jgi:hypothetical protein
MEWGQNGGDVLRGVKREGVEVAGERSGVEVKVGLEVEEVGGRWEEEGGTKGVAVGWPGGVAVAGSRREVTSFDTMGAPARARERGMLPPRPP